MSRIAGTGACLPEGILSSADVERRLKLAAGTVEMAIGVRERRVATPGQAVSDLAQPAAAQALATAGVRPDEVRLVVLATSTPDHPVPATAPHLASRLGLSCPAFDLMNTCSGWMYGLGVADRWLQREQEGAAALVVGANILSRRVDWRDWASASLFGDGAGAVVLRAGQGAGIRAIHLGADGLDWSKIHVPAGGSRTPLTPELVEDGQHLLRVERQPGMVARSASQMAAACRRALDEAGWDAGAVDWFVPHQANARLLDQAAAALGIDRSRMMTHIDRYGNTSAASIPIALHEAAADGRLRPGHRVLAGVVAGGTTWGAAAFEWTAP